MQAARTLVPSGVTAVLLCRYHGSEPARAFVLAAARAVRERWTMTRLRRQFDALGSLPPFAGCYGFPGFKTRLIAFFGYRSQPTDPVVVDLDTCDNRVVSNGQLVRSLDFPPGYQLEDELLAMTDCRGGQAGGPICG